MMDSLKIMKDFNIISSSDLTMVHRLYSSNSAFKFELQTLFETLTDP